MVKVFCDICGKQVPVNGKEKFRFPIVETPSLVNAFGEYIASPSVLTTKEIDLCFDCAMEIAEMLGEKLNGE